MEYHLDVESNILFKSTAFKHGISEADIRVAVDTFIYDNPVPEDDLKNLLLGFDAAGNLLEIMYNVVDEQRINVFHAMKCRNAFLSLLNH